MSCEENSLKMEGKLPVAVVFFIPSPPHKKIFEIIS